MDLDALATRWGERLDAERRERAQAAAEARERAGSAARLLRERWGARRVVLFGSLAGGTFSPEPSDVDLAVEGLPSESLLPALGAITAVIRWPVDLVRIEEASAALAAEIAATGEEVG